MGISGDERAVTVQVGAVILLAFVVIALTTYQVQVVPSQNEEVEYNHNQDLQHQLQELRNGILAAAETGSETPQTVSLGTTYPSRTIFLNPPAPSGTLRTVGTSNASINVSVANATAVDSDVDDYWDGTKHFSTGALVYQPNYNVYAEGPSTVYENTMLYNAYRTANITIADPNLVDGQQISLVALGGDLRANSGGTQTVDVTSLSTGTNTIEVTNQAGTNLTVTLPTYLSGAQWEEALGNEVDGSGNASNAAYVHDVSYQPVPGQEFGLVTLEFEQGETYELSLARVGVGETTGSDQTNATYMTTIRGGDEPVAEGENRSVILEVRDEYNNPISGQTVNVSAEQGTFGQTTRTTGPDGRVTFAYQASDVSGTGNNDTINASFDSAVGGGVNDAAPANVSFDVQITNTDGSGTGGGGGGGGGGAYSLDWRDPDSDNPSGPLSNCDDASCEWNVSADSDDELNLTAALNESIGGFTVEFGVNDTSVGTVSPNSDSTDGTGTAATALVAQGNGTVSVYAASGGASDRLVVTLTNVGGGGGGGNVAPTADTGGPYTVFEQNSIALDGSGSSDSDGSITSYQWQITSDPTGQATLSNANSETATFNAPDVSSDTDVTVELTVTDDGGATDTDTTTVTVEANSPPDATDMTYSPDPPNMGQQAQYQAVATDPDNNIQSYEWDWDSDGTYESTGQQATHTFATPGSHSVTLRVTDSTGATDTYTETVVVQGIRLVPNSEGATTGTNNGKNSVVFFNLSNPGSQDVTVTDVEIVSVSGSNAVQVSETNSNHEIMFDGNGDETVGTGPEDGYAEENPMSFGTTVPMDNTGVVVAGGPEAEMQFYEFVKNNGQPARMGGATITVKLHVQYADGDTGTVTITVNVP